MIPGRGIEPDELLAHSAFVRGVARSLLLDRDEVEDVSQEALLAALEARSDEPPGRGWLRRVTRNLGVTEIRRKSRRRRREEAVARGSASTSPSADVAAARNETLGRVVQAVLALEEPYRSTVIQRYYERLSCREIAVAEGTPLATVRTRLQRALAHLRGDLDSACEGDRELWIVGLFPLAGIPETMQAVVTHLASRLDATARRALTARVTVIVAVALVVPVAVVTTLLRDGVEEAPVVVPVVVSAQTGDDASSSPGALRLVVDSDPPEGAVLPPGAEGRQARLGSSLPEAPLTGQLEARLRWADGSPAARIRGRAVTLDDARNKRVTGRGQDMIWMSDEEGILRLPAAPGEHLLLLDRAGGGFEFVIVPGQRTEIDATLEAGLDVDIEVVTEEGEPVEGAEILLATATRSSDSGVVVGTTDARGAFVLRSLSKSRFIGARKAGHAPSHLTYVRGTGAEGDRRLRLVLSGPGGALHGRVVDETGEPVPDAAVILEDPTRWKTAADSHGGFTMVPCPVRTRTSGEGLFQLDGLPPGERQLFVLHPERGVLLTRVVVEVEAARDEERIVLPAPAVVEGRVEDADGSTLAGARILVQDAAICDFRVPLEVVADGSGAFRTPLLAPGTVKVEAQGSVGGSVATTLRLLPGETRACVLRVEKGLVLAGRVLDDSGRPRPGFLVRAWGPYGRVDRAVRDRVAGQAGIGSMDQRAIRKAIRSFQSATAITDEEGRFALEGRLPLGHRLEVVAPDSVLSIPSLVLEDVRPERGEIDIVINVERLPGGRITATIAAPPGEAATRRHLEVYRGDDPEPYGEKVELTGREISLGPLVPGPLTLILEQARNQVVRRTVIFDGTLAEGEVCDLGTVGFERPGSVRVRLAGDLVEPLDRIEVELRRAGGKIAISGEVKEGEILFPETPPGSYRLTTLGFASTGIACAAVPLVVEEGVEIQVSLEAERGERVLVRTRASEPAASWEVMTMALLDSSGDEILRLFGYDAMTRFVDGICLAPGRYRIELTMDSGARFSEEVEVDGDPATETTVIVTYR